MEHNRLRSRQTKRKKPKHPSLLKRINHHAAGIDCGAETHFVAVPAERDRESVRSFKTFTGDLRRLADWLEACEITTVAMESTGVYWIPVFEILEDRGFEVVLVNSRHIKNVPGRTCAKGLPSTGYSDVKLPEPGEGFWYLVRGANVCGVGVAGFDGYGHLRAATCP